MNALNEVNKVISNVSFQSSRHSQCEEDEWLTADKMAVNEIFTRLIFRIFINCTPMQIRQGKTSFKLKGFFYPLNLKNFSSVW